MIYVANDNYNDLKSYGTIKKCDYLSSKFDVDGIVYVPVSPSERTCAVIDCTYSTEVKDIVIGKTVKYKGVEMKVVEINPMVLKGNKNVESITYSVDLDIPKEFAAGCTNVKSITFTNIGKIGASAFKGCTSLTDIALPTTLTTIGDNAFEHTDISSIVIPSATTIIGDRVFNGCKSLAMLEVKDGKDELKLGRNNTNQGLFNDCPLKEVVIGRNLVYGTDKGSGYSPFYRKTTLEKVTLTDVPTEVFTNEFYGCTALKEVNIGDGVKKIGDYAFSGCSALESFAFGASVKVIGKEAFSDCTAMTRLYAEPATPPTCGTQALDDINKWECTLYVKGEAKSKYMAASQWKEFFFMEEYGGFVNGVAAPEQDAMPRKDAKAYNLNGQRVRPDRKGIYIIDGKKVIVQ